ncbi:hypothetical protein MSIMFI_03775 [Mycobacterium simulans]|uniref:hypothetical protein n=1 Tax=Mycobacterium simulans TaxID=627089 RepID=UPI00174CCCA9|nr:hypothetical protein [Mycobacterium simulans]SON62254.1 hypothetical protein MSIMFI_03775 [Mycobacterium simulans]
MGLNWQSIADKGHTLDARAKVVVFSTIRQVGLFRLGVGAALGGLAILGTLCVAGTLGSAYQWFNRFFRPEVWGAIAAWVTASIAAGAFVYAKRQVQEAKQTRLGQEKQSRKSLRQQAKLSRKALEHQAELSRQALKQQAKQFRDQMAQEARLAQEAREEDAAQAQRTRDEMAQPTVVMYAEPNPTDWQLLEVVIKNFGSTPAYEVTPTIEPPLQSLPNNLSGGELYEIPIPPMIPILAPGQEWRTLWDSAVERKEAERQIRNEIIKDWPGGPPTGTDFDPLVAERMPRTLHTGKVTYRDSRLQLHETKTILDFNLLKGSLRVKTYGIHDIAKKYVRDG